jgi:alpha-L-rhamnosidase
LFAEIGQGFTRAFVGPDGRVKGDTQTAYLLALNFDLLPEELRPLAAERLVERIADRGGRLSTGFLGLRLLLPTLTQIGRDDLAYQLLVSRQYPSWGYSIDQGATTVWERWNSYTAEKGFGNPAMNSFNHYAFGSVGEWMFDTMAGIESDGPGFKKIIIRPRPGSEVTQLAATYDSIRGLISSSWRVEGDRLFLEVTIPPNTTATVFVPADSGEEVDLAGPGNGARAKFLRHEPGASVFAVGPGQHRFVSRRSGRR